MVPRTELCCLDLPDASILCAHTSLAMLLTAREHVFFCSAVIQTGHHALNSLQVLHQGGTPFTRAGPGPADRFGGRCQTLWDGSSPACCSRMTGDGVFPVACVWTEIHSLVWECGRRKDGRIKLRWETEMKDERKKREVKN